MGMIVGIIFVGIGLVVVIPTFGPFGLFWTLVAVAITVFNAINVFSESGVAGTEIIQEGGEPSGTEPLPFDERLRRLEQLKREGLVTDEEYQRKRAELLDERW
jgi:hypothetical protein